MGPDNAVPLIERWFPVATVDQACGTPAGSGKNEKAIFTWFASRPVAQARAAVLCSLLQDDPKIRQDVGAALLGDSAALDRLADAVGSQFPERPPVVLDIFSGRGMIPLEAARVGATSIGIDVSPVATLAGRLLADYPLRDWSSEPSPPWAQSIKEGTLQVDTRPKLVQDCEAFLVEVGRRVKQGVGHLYPPNPDGSQPWGYVWAISVPCDGCQRRFPLVGNLVLRYPSARANDPGQSLHIRTDSNSGSWIAEAIVGPAMQQPTYASADLGDGRKRKGKSARCPFCWHVHSLETVKAKGIAGQYRDELLLSVESVDGAKKVFRTPRPDEVKVAKPDLSVLQTSGPYSAVPDEVVSPGNVHTVMASGYGYHTFGALMNDRQTFQFVATVDAIRCCHREAVDAGCSEDYARALASFAGATLVRRLRRSTRGARLEPRGAPDGSKSSLVVVGDLFSNEASLNFQFDWVETGPGDGQGTWASVSSTGLKVYETHIRGLRGRPARLRACDAMALPYRDGSVDLVVTDPPYYDMIEYADVSDLMFVWLKRTLFEIEPDIFGPEALKTRDGLQDKDHEIIVRRVHEPGRVRHDKPFYEHSLLHAFAEARRVLKSEGRLAVVFGHSDPNAWRRLLGALRDAGFVVTSAWPSRTESANTGVASIKVTVTIGCQVAPEGRRSATTAAVEREIAGLITERVQTWDAWGLALADQLMASYGPSMQVVGQYRTIQRPDGSEPDLDHFLAVGRRAVVDAHAFKVDELPLDTFDAETRFSIFWLRAFGRTVVNKGEAVFHAQSSEQRIDDLRPRFITEAKGGFQLSLGPPDAIHDRSAAIEVVRALSFAWTEGGTDGAAQVLINSGRPADDPHVWATLAELVRQLPESDKLGLALSACQRNRHAIERTARQTSPGTVHQDTLGIEEAGTR